MIVTKTIVSSVPIYASLFQLCRVGDICTAGMMVIHGQSSSHKIRSEASSCYFVSWFQQQVTKGVDPKSKCVLNSKPAYAVKLLQSSVL